MRWGSRQAGILNMTLGDGWETAARIGSEPESGRIVSVENELAQIYHFLIGGFNGYHR